MIRITSIPQAAASATTQELLVECTENLCCPCSVNGAVGPIGSISFSTGEVTLLNGNAVVPLIATVAIASPSGTNCRCCNQVYVEKVYVPFVAGTTNVVTLTPGASTSTELVNIKCCKAKSVKVTGTVAMTIA